MRYQDIFTQAIDRLHAEGRYRVFIDILRNKGEFPNARCFAGHNGPMPATAPAALRLVVIRRLDPHIQDIAGIAPVSAGG